MSKIVFNWFWKYIINNIADFLLESNKNITLNEDEKINIIVNMIKEYINKIIDKNFEYIKKDIYLFNYLKKIQFFNLFFDIIIVLLKEDKIKKSDLKKIKKL